MGIAQKTGATVVPPYDHPWILTGQGTAGLEIVEQAKAAGVSARRRGRAVLGGGLSTGIRARREGPQPPHQRTCRRARGLRRPRALAGERQQTKNDKLSGSICDALLAPTPGDVTFPLAKQLLGPGPGRHRR
jgi:threonine dehydratase